MHLVFIHSFMQSTLRVCVHNGRFRSTHITHHHHHHTLQKSLQPTHTHQHRADSNVYTHTHSRTHVFTFIHTNPAWKESHHATNTPRRRRRRPGCRGSLSGRCVVTSVRRAASTHNNEHTRAPYVRSIVCCLFARNHRNTVWYIARALVTFHHIPRRECSRKESRI